MPIQKLCYAIYLATLCICAIGGAMNKVGTLSKNWKRPGVPIETSMFWTTAENNCNEGLQNASPVKPDRLILLTQIRRAPIADQIAVLEWLQKKFASKQVKLSSPKP
jgi:hypothetical protein